MNRCTAPHCRQDGEQRVVLDGAYLCVICRMRLVDNLRDLPRLYDELALRLASVGGGGEPVSGNAREPGLNLSGPVADHRDLMRHTVASWCRVVVEDRGVTPPGGRWVLRGLPPGVEGPLARVWMPGTDDLSILAPWLVTHGDWLAHREFAADVHGEVWDLRRRAWSLAYPSGRKRYEVAACPETVDGQRCGGTLWATIAQVDSLLPSALVCDASEEHVWSAEQWMTLGRKIRRASA